MSLLDNRCRETGATLLVGLLLVTAGCGSFLGPSEETSTPAPTDAPTSASAPESTPTGESTVTETPAPISTETTTDGGDTHAHTHDATETSTGDSATPSGQMRVVVAGNELDVSGEGSAELGFEFADEGSYVWNAESDDVTLAEALSTLGVNATNETLSYENETYDESAENVSLAYRVNGEPVDPTERTLSDGDEVWVFVSTPEMNLSVPGEYISHGQLHVHGPIEFVVNGSEVDFSREKYQDPSNHPYFHFENGDADPWHAHSWSVTLGYAMDTLEGINVSEDSITYNGTTYEESDPGVNVTVQVNGEPVVPDEYVLKDGDEIRIVLETEAES